MANPSPSLLDSGQIIKKIFDTTDDAVRIVLASGTTFEVSLNSDEDSVTVLGNGFAGNTAALTSASTGVVMAATASVGIKSFQLYAIVNAAQTGGLTSGAIVVKIEVSPSDSVNVWYDPSSSLNVPLGTATGAVLAGSILSILIARRVRLSVVSNALVGADSVTFYLVGNSV